MYTASGTPLIRSPKGQNYLAVLKGDRINERFFFNKKMYGRFVRRPKYSGRNNEVAVRRCSKSQPMIRPYSPTLWLRPPPPSPLSPPATTPRPPLRKVLFIEHSNLRSG